jgi:hypothetical protein
MQRRRESITRFSDQHQCGRPEEPTLRSVIRRPNNRAVNMSGDSGQLSGLLPISGRKHQSPPSEAPVRAPVSVTRAGAAPEFETLGLYFHLKPSSQTLP